MIKKLKTGVEVTFNEKGEMVSVYSPYHRNEPPTQISALRYMVNQIKKIIK